MEAFFVYNIMIKKPSIGGLNNKLNEDTS